MAGRHDSHWNKSSHKMDAGPGGFKGQWTQAPGSGQQWTKAAHQTGHAQAFPGNEHQQDLGPPVAHLPPGFNPPSGIPPPPPPQQLAGQPSASGPGIAHGPPPPHANFLQFPATAPPPPPPLTQNAPPPPFPFPHQQQQQQQQQHQQQQGQPWRGGSFTSQTPPVHPVGQPSQWQTIAPPNGRGPTRQGWAPTWNQPMPNSFQQLQRPPTKESRFPHPQPPRTQSVTSHANPRHGQPKVQPYQSHRIRPKAGDHQHTTPRNFQLQGSPQQGFKGNPKFEGLGQVAPPSNQAGQDVRESDDQKWVRNWAKGREKPAMPKDEEKKPVLKLVEACNMMARFVNLLNELKKKRDEAEDFLTKENDDHRWTLRCQEMQGQMDELASIQAVISKQEFVENLKNQIQQRKRKRERSRRRREEEWHEREEAIRLQEERVNASLAKELQLKQGKEQEEALQKAVDNTLSEVRKKKQDANKTMELLRALRKLRHLRKDSAEKTGFKGPKELDTLFEEKVAGMEELMNRQKRLYVEEEKAMMVMLEEEQEESREKERQKKQLKEKRRVEKAWEGELEAVFGKTERIELGHPLFIFRQFHLQADYDIQALINIRRQWDAFLVPETDAAGSSVPIGWVTPSEPSNHIWATARELPTGS